jgi:alkylated DNA repair dioxygenase AlkB
MDTRPEIRLHDDDLDVVYRPGFASSDEASEWFEALQRQIDWRQEQVRVFGRTHPAPRLTAWYGDPGVRYRYSGVAHVANGWTDVLAVIRQRVQAAAGAPFNAVLANRYRDGRDSVSWHSDDEAALGPQPVIASVSLGGARRFRLRRRPSGPSPGTPPQSHELLLSHGSLMLMRGDTQGGWQHCVPRCARAEARINLTFRLVHPSR